MSYLSKKAGAIGAAILLAGAMALPGAAMAQTKSALTATEIDAALEAAGLDAVMGEDAGSGAPVATGEIGDIKFFVRALDCSGAETACETLVFFANFELGRALSVADFRTINAFNDSQVFGRAYVIENSGQVGVDYVIELGGGVSEDHVAKNVSRWSDVLAAFIQRFQAGPPSS